MQHRPAPWTIPRSPWFPGVATGRFYPSLNLDNLDGLRRHDKSCSSKLDVIDPAPLAYVIAVAKVSRVDEFQNLRT